MILSTSDILAAAVVFAHPWWLAGLVVVGGPVLLAAAARRRGRQVARLSVVMQCAALVALVAALARPSLHIPLATAGKWLVLNDVSASTRGQQDRASLPADITPRQEYSFAAGVAPSGQQLDTDRTDLAAALRLAAARSEELAGVIVRTDGMFTDAHWPAAAEALGRSGATVAVVPLDRPARDVRIAEFTAARTAGRQVTLRVSVIANASCESEIEIPGLLKRKLSLLPSEPTTISVIADIPEDRGANFVATLAAGDIFSENDRAVAAVGPVVRRIALIGAPGGYKPSGFAEAVGMPVDALTPQKLGRTLDHYAALVLVDDSGTLLSPAQRSDVARYVRYGGGLVIFGAGPHQSPSDRLDPLNRAAALVPNPYDRKPLSLTVALDASGSMGQTVESASGQLMKFDQAAEAVLSLKRHLTDRDTLRVIVFSDRAREIYSSGQGPGDLAKLANALRDVRPTGATNVFPALELAAKKPPDAKRKGLLIVVSDLQTEKFDPPQAAEMLKQAKLDLAIVAIASPESAPSTEPLEALRKLLDAPLEKRDHLVGLARIFAGFLSSVRGRAVRRGAFTLTSQDSQLGSAVLNGKSVDAYIVSAPHSDADVMLKIGRDDVLARRTVGLGRSVSFAIASDDRANSALLATNEFTSVLASAAKWVARRAPDARFSGNVSRSARDATVTLRAADTAGEPINLLDLSVRTLSGLNQTARETPMQQVAPGRYVAKFAFDESVGGFQVVDAGGAVVWRGGLRKTHPREFDSIGPNYANLRRLASLTGGQLVQAEDLAQIARAAGPAGAWEIWYWLAGLALTLMLLDWIASRTIQRSR
ncbi:MAG: VWA domain-containing protein [Phycisphaerae bacterium]|jgi:hypothetical protein|nr:VWA domain-containing protein [Phycisphaerae bacterium]